MGADRLIAAHRRRKCRVPIALLAIAGLSACATGPGPIGPMSDIVVTATGNDSQVESCEGFAVSAREVASFFRRAILITRPQAHDFFLRGPCYARGTLTTKYDHWRWELRNLGTGQLTSVSGDDSFLFADLRQESSLGVQ
jgi:hypothetical protein